MTDAPVSFTITAADDVVVLDLWEGTLPALPPAIRALQVEPCRWWLIGAGTDAIDLAGSGALVPVGGGLMRATFTGAGWRWLLSVSGWIDTESPVLAPGHIAASTIHHVPVWIAPAGDESCEVYVPGSYTASLEDLWNDAIGTP